MSKGQEDAMKRIVVLAAVVTGVAAAQRAQPQVAQGEAQQQQVSRYTVPSGTRVLMALQSPISTKNAQPGAPVYAQTTFPIVADGHMLIPAGSYVQGVVDKVERAGRGFGHRAQLQVHFTTLILQNGYTVSLPGALAGAPANESDKVNDQEGTVKGGANKAQRAGTAAQVGLGTASTGTLIGAASGNVARGAGIGLGAGAVAGIATYLFSRGPDIRFDAGTPVEMVLARPLVMEDQHVGNPQQMLTPIQTNRTLDKPKSHVIMPLPGAERLPFPQ